MLIKKTNIQVDIEALKNDYLQNIEKYPVINNRICLNNHTGDDNYAMTNQSLLYTEFRYMNSMFKDTIWEKTIDILPGKKGRARLMLSPHDSVLTIHRDFERRWHVALFTDPACIFYDFEDNQAMHVPADGYVYEIDTRKLHTIFNATNNFTRVHLVVCEYV